MDKARSKPIITNGISSAWLLGVNAEDGIEEFVEELCVHFGLYDDNCSRRLVTKCLVTSNAFL